MLLVTAMDRLALSARTYHGIIKAARTISNLVEKEWWSVFGAICETRLEMKYLTKKQLQTPRLAADFISWVQSEMSTMSRTQKGKGIILRREGLAKQLVEELYPIGIFAWQHFGGSRQIEITPVIGNQNYDAKVIDHRPKKSPIEFLEVTQAHEGQNEHWRNLALIQHGRVNQLGSVLKMGTKHKGLSVDVEDEFVESSKILKSTLDRIGEAIKRKANKSYPDGTALIVAFEDIATHDNDGKMALERFVRRELFPQLSNFRWVAFVGLATKTFLEFDMSKA